MPGRPPNPDSPAPRDTWTTLDLEGRQEPAPQLDGSHSERAQALWAEWWATPWATQWHHDDRLQLERLLELREAAWAQGDDVKVALLAEMRHIEDRYGFNPQARRRLYWRLAVDEPAVPVAPDSGVVLPEAGGDADPRKLRAV